MATAVDLVMFVTPLIMAIIFSVLTIIPKGKDKPSNTFSGAQISLMASILSAISWFIFGLTWPALATQDMFVSVGYLWYAIGVIFVIFAVYIGLKMLGAIFETEQPRLKLEQRIDGDGAE